MRRSLAAVGVILREAGEHEIHEVEELVLHGQTLYEAEGKQATPNKMWSATFVSRASPSRTGTDTGRMRCRLTKLNPE